MKNFKTQIKVTIVLGVASLFAGLTAHLALTDIFHGGADVTLEWTILRVCALIVLAFIGMALFTLRRALRVPTDATPAHEQTSRETRSA
jgi:hypothetical protein